MRLEDLPDEGDGAEIFKFAMSFNGYDYFGSLEATADAARMKLRSSIEDLRNEMFFAARASRHRGDDKYIETYKELRPIFLERLQGE